MLIRIFHEKLGGHVHMRVFVNRALSGKLVMRDHEFDEFKMSLDDSWAFPIEFVDEEWEDGNHSGRYDVK